MNRYIFLLILGTPLGALGSSCFRDHILDSISLNKERMKFYKVHSEGRSNRVFRRLISSEYFALAPAAYFDLRAQEYHRQGLDLFCQEFLPMRRDGQFDPQDRRIPEENLRPFDWKSIKQQVIQAIDRKDRPEVKRIALTAILELKTRPSFYCFSRHFLESIYRFAHFLPHRAAEARRLGLADPTDLLFSVMKLHALGLRDTHAIDLLALPIQQQGIPLLCSELPDLLSDLD